MIISAMGCGPAKEIRLNQGDLQDVKKIAVVVQEKHGFEVIHSRAKANATAAALFGVAGAAIAGGIDEGKDKDMAATVAPAVKDMSCSAIFVESLVPLLKSEKYEKVYIVPDANQKKDLSGYDAVVTFTIDKWGLRLVEREASNVAAFVELDIKMVKTKDSKTIWDQREVIVGDRREGFLMFSNNSELLRGELKETIKKAGFQMSNSLIYQ